MSRHAIALVAGMSCVATVLPATAQETGNVPFTGAVASTCAFGTVVPGVLGHDPAADTLSSTNRSVTPPGSSGSIAAVTTDGTFKVTVTAPTDWATGTTATPPATTFTSTYGVDATPGTAAGTSADLGTGASTVNVDLTAAPTSASASFPAGTYTAIVTVTCEKQ